METGIPNMEEGCGCCMKCQKNKNVILCSILLFMQFIIICIMVTVLVLVAILFNKYYSADFTTVSPTTNVLTSNLTEKPLKPSESVLGEYDYNSVAADQSVCSQIGSNILNIQNGNAMDAAIATVACMGVVGSQSNGIGGGSLLVFYNKTERKTYALDYRETAPAKSSEDMYVRNPTASTDGGLAIGIPGEVLGLHTAWERFGSLEWKTLLQPTIDILKNGFKVTKSLVTAMQSNRTQSVTENYRELKKYITNPATGKLYSEGDLLINEKLADTFKTIAANATSFYTGELAKDIVNEIQTGGGIITLEDLKNYKPKWRTALSPSVTLRNGIDFHSMPPPSSGAVLFYIMNIMDGYNYKPGDLSNLETKSLYYHRLAEAFKFAHARHAALGDEDFEDVAKEVEQLKSRAFADKTRAKITDDQTHDMEYYNQTFEMKEDYGTAHLSVIDSAGNAVAVTSTINKYFGSLLRGAKTGIIYNNGMDDFFTKKSTSELLPSPSNSIKPGKRPMSSMSPVIMTNSDGNVVLVSGAAGGLRIISAVAQTSMDVLYFNKTVKEANDFPRFHHLMMSSNQIECEKSFPHDIVAELKKKGHKVNNGTQKSVVQSIQRRNEKWLANCDFRKGAKPSGL